MYVCYLAHTRLRTPGLIHKCRKKPTVEPWDNIPVEFSK